MKIAKVPVLGIVSVCAGLLMLATSARAQSCYSVHASAFARLGSLENQAAHQGQADLAVRSLFGPKNELCEEGAYKNFMDLYKDFAQSAMRQAKTPRGEKLLRLTIAAMGQAPTKVPAKEQKQMASHFRQVKSDISATADEVSLKPPITPLVQQVLDTMTAVGPPRSSEPTTATVEAPTPTQGGSTGRSEMTIRVPQEPLPPWAVVKLYEMRDAVQRQDVAAIQIKLQDIINWVESKAPANP